MAKNKGIKCFCNACNHDTNHSLLHKELVEYPPVIFEEGDQMEESTEYSLLQCRGCDAITLRVVHWNSFIDISDEMEHYPPRISRRTPTWIGLLPGTWRGVLREIYSALHADAKSLALMGTRALVDMYMNSTVGDKGGFAYKLDALVKGGFLAKQDEDTLMAALEAGNAAAHRGFVPDDKLLNHTMDIVENLLQRHALKHSAKTLKAATPARHPKIALPKE